MELELTILDSRGSLDGGGAMELLAAGPGPMNEQGLLVTLALILLTLTVFGLSRTGQAVFDFIDSFGRATGSARVTGGGGGGLEFTIENR